MSIDKYFFIGAYFKFEPTEIKSQKTMNTCSNLKCKLHQKESENRFCCACGAEIKLQKIKIEEVFNFRDLLHGDNILLINEESFAMIGDQSQYIISTARHSNINCEDSMADIGCDTINEAKDAFLLAHKKDITQIENFCNIKIEVKFGCFEYWS